MPSPVQEKTKKSIERGKELKEQGSLDQAIEEFNTVLKQAPKNVGALNQLATVYAMQENWQEVVNCCYRIIGLRPDNAAAYLRLAKACAKQNNLYGAVAAFQKAIELDASQLKPIDYKELGDIFTKLGEPETQTTRTNEAIAAYKKAVELKPDMSASVHIQLADTLQQQKRFEEAIASYKKALELKPDLGERIYLKLGSAQMKHGLLDDAIANFQKAMDLKPDLVAAHRNLGDVYQQKGLLDNAIAHYQKAIELKPEGAFLYRLVGDVLTKQGRSSEAAEYYQRAESMQ